MVEPFSLEFFELALLFLLVVAVPLSGVLEFRLLTRWIRAGRAQARLRFYAWVISFEWALTLGLLVGWFRGGRGLEPLGLLPAVSEFQWLAVVIGLGLTYLVIMQMNAVLEDDEQLHKVQGELDKLSHMAPRNDPEQQMFLVLSVTAGICEEILYRGLLMSVLMPWLGWFPALLVVAVVFGLGHAYQGWEGMGKTTLVGLALGLLAWFSGSLYVAMILHAVLDLTSGRILQAAMQYRLNRIYLDE